MIKINQEKRNGVLAEQIRQQRDRLLIQCDWRSLPDSPGDRPAWLEYRQQLRDVPKQKTFPDSVKWPQPPED